MIFDVEVTTEVSDRIAEIGRSVVVPKPANYYSPEGVLFRGALTLIEDESRWCGRGIGGMGTGTHCSIHAIVTTSYKMTGDIDPMEKERQSIYDALAKQMQPDSIPYFNDHHTHAQVIAKWNEAGRANGWLT